MKSGSTTKKNKQRQVFLEKCLWFDIAHYGETFTSPPWVRIKRTARLSLRGPLVRLIAREDEISAKAFSIFFQWHFRHV